MKAMERSVFDDRCCKMCDENTEYFKCLLEIEPYKYDFIITDEDLVSNIY